MSSTALAERPVAGVPAVTKEQLDLVKRTVASGATEAELQLYLYDCARQGVHPLDRLLHFTKRGGKYTPVTSIDLMRSRAADTGEYAGSDDAVFVGTSKADEWAATVTVWRLVQGQRCPFTATARWGEYKPDSAHMWQRMPHTMLAKCAEALALRKGFPRQLAGLYAAEEMAQAERGTTESNPIAPLPVEKLTVIDTQTGEEKPLASLPAVPEGYHRVTGYRTGNGWHEAHLLAWDAQGGALKVATKKQKVGALLQKFCENGDPVKVDITMKARTVGEAFLNDIHSYAVAEGLKAAQPEPLPELTADDIPF
jgi:phage recombination protein Bet